MTLTAGDAFTFPPRCPHTFRATGRDGHTRVLWVLCPGLPADEHGRFSGRA